MTAFLTRGSLHLERIAGILLLSVFAVSCAKVGPDFVRPSAQVSDHWIESNDERVRSEFKDHRQWWTSFQDPVLDRLIEIAYRENLTVRSAGVRVLQARAELGIVVGRLYPQSQSLSGSLDRTRSSERSAGAPQDPGQLTSSAYFTTSQAQVGGAAAWELDFWGKFRRAVESADASLLGAVADYDNALVTLTAEVATSYIQLRTYEERLKIAHENAVIQRESLRLAEAKFRGGATTQRDVEQAKTLLASTEATIPALQILVEQAEHSLSLLLGKVQGQLDEILAESRGIPSPPPDVAVGIPAELLRRRPDIRSAELQAAAQCAQVGVAKADLYPHFSLQGSFGFLSTDVGRFKLEDMFLWKSRTGSLGPSFQWDVLNYGRLTNNVRVQDALFQQAILTYQQAVLRAQKEVEDALIGFLRAQEQAKLLKESTEAATRSLKLAMAQYREGMTDFTTVFTAQQALLEQQNNWVSTLGDIGLNLVSLYRALGGGWQLREGQDFVPGPTKAAMSERTDWGDLLDPKALPSSTQDRKEPAIRRPDW